MVEAEVIPKLGKFLSHTSGGGNIHSRCLKDLRSPITHLDVRPAGEPLHPLHDCPYALCLPACHCVIVVGFSVNLIILSVNENNFFTRLMTACFLLTRPFAWLHATAPLLCTALD
jgi:hypothetical protein